ncbi:MAG: hypothetical protein ACKO3W_08330 [bacterium]
MAKQLPKQVQVTVNWMKSNTLIVVFAAIIVVVPVGAFFAADAFGSGVRGAADAKARTYSSVSSALNASVDLPIPGGESVRLEGLPNEKTVEEFRKILANAVGDSQSVYNAAMKRNQGNPAHEAVVDRSIFPNYAKNFGDADRSRVQFARALAKRYEALLKSVNAGMPPSGETVVAKVSGAEKRILADAGVPTLEKIEDQKKRADAQEKLLEERLGAYGEEAKRVSLYAAMSAFGVPSEDDPAIATPLKDLKETDAQDRLLYDLQWQYWIASDVMHAFAAANGGRGNSVLKNPVKRLVSLRVLPMESVAASAATGEAMSMGGGDPSADASAATADGSAPAGDASASTASDAASFSKPAIDETAEAAKDFSKRLTGRVSNPIYDVRLVEVVFIAETAKLPLVFGELADQNFMTVTNVKFGPADQFAAARLGYLYGSEPVSEVTATIETVWFRDWTAVHMPAVLRTALGIQSEPPQADPAADASAATSGM